MIEIPQKLTSRIYDASGLDLHFHWLKLTRALFRFGDEINPFGKKNLLDGTLPVYDLELSPADLRHFDNLSMSAIKLGYMPNDKNTWRSAKLSINGKVYDVEARFHGDSPPHWTKNLKSYQIKTDKTEYIGNMRRFNLIIFEDRFFTAKIARFVSQSFGLQDIRDDLVVLRINGVVQGVYYLQEKIDSTFLEYNQCSNCYATRLTDNWVEDHPYNIPPYQSADENGIFWGSGHISPFDYDIANLDIDETELDEAFPGSKAFVQYRLNELFDAVKKNDPDVIRFFDVDYLSSFEAFRAITGSIHIIAGDNFHMAYKATNGKFYPIPDSEAITILKINKGGFERYLNAFATPIDIFYLLNQNDELRYLRNKKLYSFITNNTLLEYYDGLVKDYKPYLVSYKTNTYDRKHIKYRLQEDKNILKHNMELIKKNLEYSKAYLNVIESGNNIQIELIPDSIAQLKFDTFRINLSEAYSGTLAFTFIHPTTNISLTKSLAIEKRTNVIELLDIVNGLYFSAGLDENLYPEKRYYSININFNNADKIFVDSVDVKFRNDITNREIPKSDTYVQIANGNSYYINSEYMDLQEFNKKYPQFGWTYAEGKITLPSGKYVLYEDIIIPKNYVFNIEAGAEISIAEGKSILSYSPVNILGTENNPVTVKALDKDKPFGTFAIVGDVPKQRSVIRWLDLSGGNEAWINGMYFSGQFAINHMDVIINNTKIHGSHSDDGINIKYSDVFIDNSKFFGNSVDQVDLDFVTGIVKNSEFDGIGGEGGDNLDFSGSNVLVKNNHFSGSSDKGVSIGEESKVILYGNIIADNNIGAAVKDLSNAYFIENDFRNNKVAIDSYQKKQLFGAGFSYIYNNNFELNQKDFSKDENSKIFKIKFDEVQYNNFLNNIENDLLIFPE